MADQKFNIVNGVRVPTLILQEKVDQLKQLQLYDDDVWILGFPKCGTHWLAQIVKLLRNSGEIDGVNLPASVHWLEASSGDSVGGVKTGTFASPTKPEDLARPRILKSHFSYENLPCGSPDTSPGRYIYVARNPKDRMVSMYYMLKI